MDSRNYNRIWLVILATILLTGCAMWSVPMELTNVELDLTAMVIMIVGGVGLVTWLLTEPRAVLEAIFLQILARLERHRIRRSPFWRRGRYSEDDLRQQILPLLRYCGIAIVEAADIRVCFVSLPNVPSPG